tara:strand:+ start:2023 stop:3066 length:1044 start_codon:yes stop_codon:yes gene_type:complete
MKKKIAVILFNLGGPDNLNSVKPFLFNLFNDKAIIQAPKIIRYFLAKLIAKKREKTAKKIYSYIGGKSPIYDLTILQANELEKILTHEKENYKVFISMRYWLPLVSNTIVKVKKWNPNKIILLPLYPQFSSTTSASSINSWHKESKKVFYNIDTKIICCYPKNEKFIKAHVNKISDKLKEIKKIDKKLENSILLFSAHGLPERIIKKGDPYKYQVELTVKTIMKNLNEKIEHAVCYQSKIGPLKWIEPSTKDIIIKNAKLNKNIILIPIAFVSEHSETLVELDIEYKKLAKENGCDNYYRISALGTNKEFILALSSLIKAQTKNKFLNKRICPPSCSKCLYNKEKIL